MTQTRKALLTLGITLAVIIGVAVGMALIWFVVIPFIGFVLEGFFNALMFPFS